MKQTNNAEAYERALLSHVDMCYSVALVLTHDSDQACQLAWDVLTSAWQARAGAKNTAFLKTALLTELRTRFEQTHRPVLAEDPARSSSPGSAA